MRHVIGYLENTSTILLAFSQAGLKQFSYNLQTY